MEKYRYSQGQRLSGGQKQRIAIASALAISPEILILDESTAMLDPKGREEVLSVVKKLNDDGITVICITHYMDEVIFADRVIVMHQGKIVKQGAPKEIFANANELKTYGLEVPRAVYIANELRSAGLPLSTDILTETELSNELCKLFQKG
jgi:energy-coupling factor transport system ATP-binding protein